MKEYKKPEVELIRFTAEEDILLDGDFGGNMGTSGLPDGWE